DELRIGKEREDGVEVARVHRSLVAPPGLARLLGVDEVAGADHRAEGGWRVDKTSPQLLARQAEPVGAVPLPPRDLRREGFLRPALAEVGEPCPDVPDLGQVSGF